VICPNCQKEIGPVQEPGTYVSMYYCQSCRTEIPVWETIHPGDQVLDHGRYRFYIDNKNNRARIEKIYMDIETDTSICYRWYTLLELPSIPENLTKDNVEEKIKLYLLFS
jgi:hypothetical protein